MKRKNFSLRFALVLFFCTILAVAAYAGSQKTYADVVLKDETFDMKEFQEQNKVRSCKTWTINFSKPVGYCSSIPPITVTDSKNNNIDVSTHCGTSGNSIVIDPPDGGYKHGETYTISIPKDTKFQIFEDNYSLNKGVKFTFTVMDENDDSKYIDINEGSPITKANNSLSVNLIKNLVDKDNSSNIFVSPFSLSTILAEVENGSDGTTQKEMLNAMGFSGIDTSDINEEYYNVLDYYKSLKSGALKTADSIWVNQNFKLNDNFINESKKYYKSQVSSEDFLNDSTVNKINDWVDKNTNGQIKDLISNINKDDAAILVNAVHFNGKWINDFPVENTTPEDFTLSNGTKTKVSMMKDQNHIDYLKGSNFKAIKLPYSDNMEMDIFLPDEGVSINDFMKEVTKENLNSWMDEFENHNVKYQIPKFNIDYETHLVDTLKILGMKQAFDSSNADFKKMSDSNSLFISDILQKTAINVDEKGTQASAVTGVMMAGSAAPRPEDPVEFVANRPFFFTIKDNNTGMILFTGKIENPTASTTK